MKFIHEKIWLGICIDNTKGVLLKVIFDLIATCERVLEVIKNREKENNYDS